MLQIASLGYTLRWSLVLGCLLGVLLGLALVESRVKKLDRAEGKPSWIMGQMTLGDPMRALE